MTQRNAHTPAPQEAELPYQRINIDLASLSRITVKASSRKIVVIRADGIGAATAAKAFAEQDGLDGSLRAAALIVLSRGAPDQVPTLVSPDENLVVVVAPPRQQREGDEVFAFMWRHAVAAMAERPSASGFRAAVFPGGMLSLRSDSTLPSGRFEFFALASELAELPPSVVTDIAAIVSRDPAGLLN